MIKLTDLIDEIELRDTPLNIPKSIIMDDFFEDYELENVGTGNRMWTKPLNDGFYDYIDEKSKVVAQAGDIKLIKPKGINGHYFLVNDDARNNPELNNYNGYLAGFIDADVLSVGEKNLAPYQMKGIEIHLTFVFEGYRGMGLGSIMYQMLLQAYKTVFSDSILYEASRAVWVNKLAPMANGSSIIFGGRYNNTIVPLSVEDAASDAITTDIDKYFITTNPPAELRKIGKAVNGLSLSKNEFGVFQPISMLRANDLDMMSDKVDSIPALIDVANLQQVVGNGDPAKLEKAIIETRNAIMVADELGNVKPI
jgi:hypothetical protein